MPTVCTQTLWTLSLCDWVTGCPSPYELCPDPYNQALYRHRQNPRVLTSRGHSVHSITSFPQFSALNDPLPLSEDHLWRLDHSNPYPGQSHVYPLPHHALATKNSNMNGEDNHTQQYCSAVRHPSLGLQQNDLDIIPSPKEPQSYQQRPFQNLQPQACIGDISEDCKDSLMALRNSVPLSMPTNCDGHHTANHPECAASITHCIDSKSCPSAGQSSVWGNKPQTHINTGHLEVTQSNFGSSTIPLEFSIAHKTSPVQEDIQPLVDIVKSRDCVSPPEVTGTEMPPTKRKLLALSGVEGPDHSACDSGMDGLHEDQSSEVSTTTKHNPKRNGSKCQVCGDVAAGFHCGAFVCEACKKFYIRAQKQSLRSFTCPDQSSQGCEINKLTRTSCAYCRYKKCLTIGMHPPGCGVLDTMKVSSIPCKVCGAPSSGLHFGVLTCEGCKGFFRRSIREQKNSPLLCQKDGKCDIDSTNRNVCRPCRLRKCISVGMATTSSLKGRQPNSVRYIRIMEHYTGENKSTLSDHEDDSPSTCQVELANVADINTNHLLIFKEFQANLYSYRNDQIEDPACTETQFVNEIAKSFLVNLQNILTFLRNVHGFSSLHIEDRVKLTQHSIYPLLLLVFSQKYELVTGEHNMFNYSHQAGLRMVKFFPEYQPVHLHFRDIGRSIKQANMDDVEQSLLCMVVVLRSVESCHLKWASEVTTLHDLYAKKLKLHVEEKYGSHVNRLGSLLLLVTELHRAAKQHAFVAKVFSLNHQDSIPEIYNEVFVKGRHHTDSSSDPSPQFTSAAQQSSSHETQPS